MSAGGGTNSRFSEHEERIWAATYAAAFVVEATNRLLIAANDAAQGASFHQHAAAMGIKTNPPTGAELLDAALASITAADLVKVADVAVWKLRQYVEAENARLAPNHVSWASIAIDPDEMARYG